VKGDVKGRDVVELILFCHITQLRKQHECALVVDGEKVRGFREWREDKVKVFKQVN
jgi:hypothetical protein